MGPGHLITPAPPHPSSPRPRPTRLAAPPPYPPRLTPDPPASPHPRPARFASPPPCPLRLTAAHLPFARPAPSPPPHLIPSLRPAGVDLRPDVGYYMASLTPPGPASSPPPLCPQVVTSIQGVGYMASLAGFAWYNQIKLTHIASGAEPAAVKAPQSAA